MVIVVIRDSREIHFKLLSLQVSSYYIRAHYLLYENDHINMENFVLCSLSGKSISKAIYDVATVCYFITLVFKLFSKFLIGWNFFWKHSTTGNLRNTSEGDGQISLNNEKNRIKLKRTESFIKQFNEPTAKIGTVRLLIPRWIFCFI